MAASEAAVTAVMATLGCRLRKPYERKCDEGCDSCTKNLCGEHGDEWTDRGCPVAVAAADKAVDADRASIQAGALREAAAIGPLRFAATHTGRGARGWNVVEAKWLRDRASEIEAQP